MKITTQMVKDLREATSAGIMDAKKAVEATNGDVDAAIEIYQQVIQDAKERKAIAAQAQLRLGQCYLQKNQSERALEAFQKHPAGRDGQSHRSGDPRQARTTAGPGE